MKLTKQEYQNLVDSRLVDLENVLKAYKENEPLVSNATNISNLKALVECAEQLLEAYEAKVEAEEDEQAEEAEKEYQKEFGGE